MHKTIYIDVEDEITGIIDRIRSEGATDIFLVVPKNAMLVQGMLNLKILKKEAVKMGKNVMLVTNDKFARKVIERAGLETVDRPVENEANQVPADFSPNPLGPKEAVVPQEASDEAIKELRKIEQRKEAPKEIGSPSFFDSSPAVNASFASKQNQESESGKLREELYSKRPPGQEGRKISVNNSYPLHKAPVPAGQPANPALRSNNFSGNHRSAPAFRQGRQTTRRININNGDERRQSLFGPDQTSEDPIKISQGIDLQHGWNNKKAEDFFSHGFEPVQQEREKEQPAAEKPRGGIFKFFAVISVIFIFLAALAAYVYLNYPKAAIELFPASDLQNVSLDVVASVETELADVENAVIPATLQQVEIEKTVRFETTEEKFVSDDGKASGKVTIYNKYSSSPQPLVATTRVLSKEGKLFRLKESVTVPGMEGEKAGTIEVAVIADKPGEEYNIGPSSFSVEGFKGSPKYEKFEVSSDSPMSGGNNESGNKKARVVTASDIESARQKTLEELDRDLEKLILEKVGSGSKVLADTARKEIISNASSLSDGEIGDSFTYTIKEKIQVLVFNEEDIRELLVAQLEKDLPSGYNLDNISGIEYNKAVTDFENKKMNMKVSSVGTLVAQLDTGNIKKGIAGKNEDGMRQFLENYSDLNKAQIKISPAWLGSLPVAERKMEIRVIKN